MSTPQERLEELFTSAFPTNHPAMHDYVLVAMELKELRQWKESAMELESRTNRQAIAKTLALPIGREISANILPAIMALRMRLDRAQRALMKIARWEDFPPSGRKWPDGSAMDYRTAFGSNGERDYMRGIARAAVSTRTSELPSGDAVPSGQAASPDVSPPSSASAS